MADKKVRITKSQRFEDIKALLQTQPVQYGTTVKDALEVIDHELELLAKKNSSDGKKQTEAQKVNEGVKEEILDFLGTLNEGEGVTITDLIKRKGWLEDYSVNKISALMRQLKDAGLVAPKTVKGKTLFSLA